MSKYFNFWKMCYENEWVSLDMVKQAASKNIVTTDEFKTITGQDYTAQ
ncbi:XkdX family protein [Clostridium kluyveri]|nr:XkdX family protein [Clostridium kluyveri]UZQ50614.1 XkdX family protein [Clostridium kluyveri]UZQ51576.1 XkdX family protein [Clostridium kluyveri]